MYFEFDAKIQFKDMSGLIYHVVYLPENIAKQLPLKKNPRLRIEGEINEWPINMALQPEGGRWYLLISKKLMKNLEVQPGDRIEVYFKIADQNFVDIPDELKVALSKNNKIKKAWDKLTPGKQRNHAHRVHSAKRPETVSKRIAEVIIELKK